MDALFIYNIIRCFKTKFIKIISRIFLKLFCYFIWIVNNSMDCKSSELFRSYSRKWLFCHNLFLLFVFSIFGIFTKFIPFSFLITLVIFILKQSQENEFIILWTAGIKKIKIVNLFIIVSFFILLVNLLFANLITPLP